MAKNIRKLRSKYYTDIIEVNVPLRFYWNNGQLDGFEFGPLDGLTKYERLLFKTVMELMANQTTALKVIDYLKDKHPDLYGQIVDQIDYDNLTVEGIPDVFVDAFEDKPLE